MKNVILTKYGDLQPEPINRRIRNILSHCLWSAAIKAVLVLPFVVTPAFSAPRLNPAAFEASMEAGLYGPEKKKIDIYGHEFNVKPMRCSVVDKGTISCQGHISHHLSYRPDDQVYYTIVKEGNVIKEVTKSVDKGGAAPLLAPIASVIAQAYGIKGLTPEQATDVFQRLGRLLDGRWETSSDFIIANLAIRMPGCPKYIANGGFNVRDHRVRMDWEYADQSCYSASSNPPHGFTQQECPAGQARVTYTRPDGTVVRDQRCRVPFKGE